MVELRFHRRVPDDLGEAIAWFEGKSPQLGDKFRADANLAFDVVAAHPLQQLTVDDGRDIRCTRVGRFSYYVYFQVIGSTALILGVRHGAADPQTWLRRAAR